MYLMIYFLILGVIICNRATRYLFPLTRKRTKKMLTNSCIATFEFLLTVFALPRFCSTRILPCRCIKRDYLVPERFSRYVSTMLGGFIFFIGAVCISFVFIIGHRDQCVRQPPRCQSDSDLLTYSSQTPLQSLNNEVMNRFIVHRYPTRRFAIEKQD